MDTKAMLKKALLELSDKKPLDKITVSEITKHSGLSRETFYSHFTDKYDLIREILKTSTMYLVDEMCKGEITYTESLVIGMTAVKNNLNFYQNACSLIFDLYGFDCTKVDKFQAGMAEQTRKSMMSYLINYWKLDVIPPDVSFSIMLYANGFVSVYKKWILGELNASIEEMVSLFKSAYPENIYKYFTENR